MTHMLYIFVLTKQSEVVMVKYVVTLTPDEREMLERIVNKGKYSADKVRNALILLSCDVGEGGKKHSNEVICDIVRTSMRTIDRVKKKFVEQGLEAVMGPRQSNRVYKKKVDGEVEAHLIALCCSDPPSGYARWSLRLLADKLVELKYVEDISHEAVRQTLKKTNLNLGRR
jgi:transposase